jgi:murein DD-endopeptidase MepM/ murein hydrolase activator NlpD
MRRRLLPLVLSLTLILSLVPALAGAQSQGPTYIVQPGDTLSGIARTFGSTVEQLAQINGISDPSALQPGAELIIPGFEGVSGVLSTHEVAYGEDLISLSRTYGLSPDVMVRLNHVVSPGSLYLGQEVILPQNDGPDAMPQATADLVLPGDTRLEQAIRDGLNPWALDAANGLDYRAWLMPGSVLLAPGGDQPPNALPSPILDVAVDPPAAVQGQVEEIHVTTSSDVALGGSLGSWALNFESEGPDQQVALQGVDALTDPGLYDLTVTISPAEGGDPIYSYSQPIRVRSGDYGYDPILNVPPETLDPANTVPEETFIEETVGQVTPEKLWDGAFQFPSDYYTESFPSVFGTRRNYNGTGYIRYHTGLDFYGGVGTPILAPAPGKVVFAGPLTVRGNTTIIDHGWGVFTMYFHQSEFEVEPGDDVSTGQEIGKVGGTGRVTGPHLHWEVRVGGVAVDPLEWVNHVYP